MFKSKNKTNILNEVKKIMETTSEENPIDDDSIVECAACSGKLLKKFAKTRRTKTYKDNKVRLWEVFICARCDSKLNSGEVIASFDD